MFERIAGAPALGERPALSQQSARAAARATATAPGATTSRWRHRGATRWPSKPPASASAKAPAPATPTIMVSAAPVGAEGQPAGGGADHARRQDRWRSHPVGRDEGGVRAQRRGSADTGEAVARQPLPPAE